MSQSNEVNLQKISCTLLPGKYTSEAPVPELYNHVYNYWKKTWTEFFEKAGSGPGALNIENFMRHSFIITLHQENNIVGTLLASMFNVSAATTYDHPCVKPFPSEVLQKLKDSGRGLCITGEYLSVHPEFRKEIVGMSMADVLIGVLMKIYQKLDLNMALAATVRAAKVDTICKKYGYTELGSYLKIGVDCIMLFNTQETCREHPDPAVATMVDHVWAKRKDLTELTLTNEIVKKAA